MDRRNILRLSAIAVLGFALLPGGVLAQKKSLKEQLLGTWTYASVEDMQANGTVTRAFGAHPSGLAIFEANGEFAVVLTRPDLPKYASNNRMTGTAEENKATAQGTLAQFGTYVVNEADQSFTIRAVGSSYPNIIGKDRKFVVASITGDDMKWTIPGATAGGTGTVRLRRVK
jgi:hypothetical protein